MKKVWNKETRRPDDNMYYRNGDWSVEVEDDFSDDNFTEVSPPTESLENSVPCDWDESTGQWILDTVANDRYNALETLEGTDIATIRIVEDLINTLISKGTIALSDLPQAAQDRLNTRSAARENL